MSRGYTRGASRDSLLSKKNDNQFSSGQIQNVKSSRVYVFGNDSVVQDEEEEYELEMSEIRSRRGMSQPSREMVTESEPSFFDKELSEGDTLQKIALQYSCPVSELKRINNLIRDQDFYALRKIKVPIRRYGVLSEIIEEEKKKKPRETFSTELNSASYMEETGPLLENYDDPESSHDLSDPDTQMKIIRTLSIRDNINSQSREAENFLKSMDKDLSKMKKSRGDRNSLDEVISVLTNKTFYPLERRKSQAYNGADCGMSYRTIIATVIVLCIVIPVVLGTVYHFKGFS
ncbi:lysM and putative peptidoglycan-binding domain-containing protein 3-like [Haliotis rufescens]|uniref:lysM and putative peptidoglycan-binding domain-containing protein 3-like n=1 Tax=Haliotis rufescens TaxID=6454 RepID=UPI001EB02739|nr:lysM and putative peptidoglycan-binding domain-containing protein 3-like [Haliotis rufescens]